MFGFGKKRKPAKKFKLSKENIRELAPSRGGCMVTDAVVVHGQPIGLMLREAPERAEDSGWVFQASGEPGEQLDESSHWNVFDVNTVANYDPAIIQFLDEPVGTVVLLDSDGTLKKLNDEAAAAFLSR